mmetsp:Transcript_52114/g.86401  ORF Transcript_52114/g.86401 Transcript_52114/m.86401 type:complete len:342 (-) Transcript_52114:85-1110(-)
MPITARPSRKSGRILLLVLATAVSDKLCRTSEEEPEPDIFIGPITTGQRMRMPMMAGLDWQLFLPTNWHNASTQRYPIVVFLHGSGDGHFSVMNSQSLPRLLHPDQSTCFDPEICWHLPTEFRRVTAKVEAPASDRRAFINEDQDLYSPLADCNFAATFPGIVIMPQGWLPERRTGWTKSKTRQVEQLVRHVLIHFHGDPTRVVLSGQSAGGHGAWAFASARPRLWSALNPICMPAPISLASQLAGLPIWVVGWAGDGIHGNDAIVEALKIQALKTPLVSVRYTRYNKAPGPPDPLYQQMRNHASYDLIYRDPRLWEWAFHQRNPAGEAEWGLAELSTGRM